MRSFRSRIPAIDWAVVLPGDLNVIEAEAFADDTAVSTVKLGDSVCEIRAGAFAGCTGLTYVYIPDSVVSIGQNAFDIHDGLTLICETDNTAEYARNNGIYYLVVQRTNE